jgi:hypothetical protein
MTIASAPSTDAVGVPALTLRTIVTILVAGSVATIAFDLFGQAISPMLGFPNLAPVPLATQTWSVFFGQAYAPGGHLLHYVAGLIAYPVGWMFIWRPIVGRIVPGLPWLLSSVLYGVGLWVFALYIMAHLVAGNPPFLGFTGITWVALAGHILFAVVAAMVIRARGD